MSLGGSLKVIGAGLFFRSAGTDGAGYKLLDAFSDDDEQEKMLAGISLVKAGERSVDLIEKAGKTGRLTPDVVRLLADIGGPGPAPSSPSSPTKPDRSGQPRRSHSGCSTR